MPPSGVQKWNQSLKSFDLRTLVSDASAKKVATMGSPGVKTHCSPPEMSGSLACCAAMIDQETQTTQLAYAYGALAGTFL